MEQPRKMPDWEKNKWLKAIALCLQQKDYFGDDCALCDAHGGKCLVTTPHCVIVQWSGHTCSYIIKKGERTVKNIRKHLRELEEWVKRQ